MGWNQGNKTVIVNYGVLGTIPSLSCPCESPDHHCWPPSHNQMLFQLDGASKFSALSQCYYSCLTRPAPPSGRHGPLVPYSKGLTSSWGSRHYCLRPYPPIMTEPGADWPRATHNLEEDFHALIGQLPPNIRVQVSKEN